MSAAAPPAAPAARAAVIGHPVAHSKSPLLHAAAYAGLGFDVAYAARDVPPAGLEDFVRTLRAEPGWRGLSVTMPHKGALAALTDVNTPLVEALGVLNTVTVSGVAGERVLTGHNTDVAGVAGALAHAGAGITPEGGCVVLGGGGTAAAAVAGLARLGARTISIHVRRIDAAAGLVPIGAALGTEVRLLGWDEAPAAIRSAGIVISTLPPRAADSLAAALTPDPAAAAGAVRPAGVLLDVAYDPWPSALAAAWERAGGTVVHGLEMLLYQAIEQVRLFLPEAGPLPQDVINRMCDAVGLARR